MELEYISKSVILILLKGVIDRVEPSFLITLTWIIMVLVLNLLNSCEKNKLTKLIMIASDKDRCDWTKAELNFNHLSCSKDGLLLFVIFIFYVRPLGKFCVCWSEGILIKTNRALESPPLWAREEMLRTCTQLVLSDKPILHSLTSLALMDLEILVASGVLNTN